MSDDTPRCELCRALVQIALRFGCPVKRGAEVIIQRDGVTIEYRSRRHEIVVTRE